MDLHHDRQLSYIGWQLWVGILKLPLHTCLQIDGLVIFLKVINLVKILILVLTNILNLVLKSIVCKTNLINITLRLFVKFRLPPDQCQL